MNAKQMAITGVVAVVCVSMVSTVSADTFGTGANQFSIDFVTISGATNPASGIAAGDNFTFTGVNNDYRMGTYEITNDQWDKFKVAYGTVTGSPSNAYEDGSLWTGTFVPVDNVSWYEAAQFVNWLNTSTGHQAAYKFTGMQGTSNYTLATWSTAEADNATNLYRHKDAKYYLPTEDEWVKAAYWNGTILQTYATKAGDTLRQGDGVNGAGWNYHDNGYATDPVGPWNVGSGSEELNDTLDMMGNAWEWMESPDTANDYGTASNRGMRGAAIWNIDYQLASSFRSYNLPYDESTDVGFRVASEVPEPATLGLLALGGFVLLRKRRSQSMEVRSFQSPNASKTTVLGRPSCSCSGLQSSEVISGECCYHPRSLHTGHAGIG